MPTARELLDQADALMRRNRAPIVDDIPVLTDSVMPQTEARLLRGRASGVPARPPPPDPIPTLTERVAVSEPDSVAQEGEPSDWLQLEGGEPSVLGDAPDSIAIVPEVANSTPAENVDIFAPEPDSAHVQATKSAEETFDEEVGEPAPATSTTAAALAAEFAHTMPPVEIVPPVEDAAEFEEEAVDLLPLPELPPLPAEPEPEVIAAAPVPPEPEPEVIVAAPPPPEPEAEPTPVTVASPEQERARWDSITEEIRMQVLQRIDLFTDTGLREQLGMRLQPIVDRASADLVATINQHVGELLRAYVAEAIEREIENWRRNN